MFSLITSHPLPINKAGAESFWRGILNGYLGLVFDNTLNYSIIISNMHPKQIISASFLFMALVLPFIGCGNSTKMGQPVAYTPPAGNSGGGATTTTTTGGGTASGEPTHKPPRPQMPPECLDGCAPDTACAGHFGPACIFGPDTDGSVICRDGFMDDPQMFKCPDLPTP